jgi:hypothetical protein
VLNNPIVVFMSDNGGEATKLQALYRVL